MTMSNNGTVVIQVPGGWLQLTREEYATYLIPDVANGPRLYTAAQMEELTSIPARRWIEMAKRSEIPYASFGDRSYRFDFHKVYSVLEVKPARNEEFSMRKLIREVR